MLRRSAAAIASGFALLVAAPLALGDHGPSTHYSKDNPNDCGGGFVDPIGAKFVGDHAGPQTVLQSLTYHASMFFGGDPEADQGLYVYTPDTTRPELRCKGDADSRSTGGSPRHHARVWGSRQQDWPNWKSVATPHKEEVCGFPHHCVIGNNESGPDHLSGYDQTRQKLKKNFNDTAAHNVDTVYWGNTQGMEQRDGDVAASSGHVIIVTSNHSH